MVANCPQGLGNNTAVDFEEIWAVLGASLREIHDKNASRLSFEELYRNAYKIVLKKQGEALYARVKDFEREWLVGKVRPEILEELSINLLVGDVGVSSVTTTNERRTAGEKFLQAIRRAWEDHHLCMGMTSDVLMYMVWFAADQVCNMGRNTLMCIRSAFTVRTTEYHQSSRPASLNFGTTSTEHPYLRRRMLLLQRSFSR